MAEKKTEKNPLAQMFGAFLRKERNKMELSSVVMAGKLELSDAMLRMIESGNANLQPAKTFLIIQACTKSTIQFNMLSQLLVGIQYVQSLMDDGQKPSDAFADLAGHDFNFETLHRKVHHFFQLGDSSAELKEFINDHASEYIGEFLKSNYYQITVKDDKFIKTLKDNLVDVRTLSLDLILEFIRAMGMHPPMHINGIAEKWEETNQDRITDVIGIYRYPSLIISEENLRIFSHPYLKSDKFTSVQYIFVDTKESPAALKKTYLEKLKELHKISDKTIEIIEPKVQMKVASNTSFQEEIDSILLGNMGDHDEEFDAFWVFRMSSDNRIGFLGVKEKRRDQIINLKYGEMQEKCARFEKLWDKLPTSKK
ncbi:MAG: hypothetical protein JSS76_04580 [Bacteroidetes bacterium]|nr:hypothetical protein [Bacteroidota bacterium]